jgi:hypothetical protein
MSSQRVHIATGLLLLCGLVAACEGDPIVPGANQPPRTVRPLTIVVPSPVARGDHAPYDAIAQDELSLGSADAPVTIAVYTNFLCGNCADFARDIMPPLVAEYVSSNRVRFVFHHAPLGGEAALRAHEASHCAADQDRFWQTFAQLFANFSQQTEAYSDARLREMAINAGVDAGAFDECFNNSEHRAEIEAAVNDFGQLQRMADAGFAAATAQARQRPLLPVVFVNERAFVSPTLEEMRAIIEEELP